MKNFKYTEYISYKNSNNIEEPLGVYEERENYEYEKPIIKINSEHDKVIKLGLENKEEVAKLINQELNLKKPIKANDIEKYKNEFIDKYFKRRQADVVYKIKGSNIFFLIEHQSSVDNLMPIRVSDYQMKIIQSAITMKNKTRLKRGEKIPFVIPIVIYMGKEKWKVQQKFKDAQEQLKGEEIYMHLGDYCLVDVRDRDEKEIIEGKSFLYKVILLESTTDPQTLYRRIRQIISNEQNLDNKELLYNLIERIYLKKIENKEKVKEILSKLKEGGEEDMIEEIIMEENRALIEKGRMRGLREGKLKGIAEGRKKGILEGKAQGRTEGIAEGKKEGRKEGKTEGKAEIINSLKQKMGKKGKIEITLKDLEELISQTSQKVG